MKSHFPGVFSLVLLTVYCTALPASNDAVEGDVQAVGSLRREVRQPAPQGFAGEVPDLLNQSNNKNKKVIKNTKGKNKN